MLALLTLLTGVCWIGYCLYFELKTDDIKVIFPLGAMLLFSMFFDEKMLLIEYIFLAFLVLEGVFREKKLSQEDLERRFKGWLIAIALVEIFIAIATGNTTMLVPFILVALFLFFIDFPVYKGNKKSESSSSSEQNYSARGGQQNQNKKRRKAQGTSSTKGVTLFVRALGYYLSKNKQYFTENIYTEVRFMLMQDFPDVKLHDNFSSYLIKTNNLKYFQGGVLLDSSVQKMLMGYFLKLTLSRANMQRADFDDIASLINKIRVDSTLQKEFLEQYKSLEKYKALIILLKYMATVSGFASEKENEVAYAYLKRIEKESGANKLSLSFEKIYSLLGNNLKRTAYQAIDYLSMISLDERKKFIKVMFDVANAEDGIIYPELSFLSVCSFYAGLSESEFQQLCKEYNVEWNDKYSGGSFEGFPYGYSFAERRESAWKQIEELYLKQQKKQKQSDSSKKSANTNGGYGGGFNYNSSNKQDKYQKRQQHWQDWQDQQQQQQRQQQQSRRSTGLSLSEAYAILGVSENVSNDEIKKCYRKMALKYHPDRLGIGASQRDIQKATEKITQINQAYDVICKAKGIK